jgi:4-hydroxybenzoate polyprenyltransferase
MPHAAIARTRALAASLRLANLPSVLSNVAVGAAFSGQAGEAGFWTRMVAAGSAGVLLCAAGNLLNDFKDVSWDRVHRPERALPQGLFPPAAYLIAGLLMLIAAGWISVSLGAHAAILWLVILLALVAYTWLHKSAAWTVALVALCRGLLPLLGFAAMKPETPLLASAPLLAGLALFLHVIGLSFAARRETHLAKERTITGFILIIAAAMAAASSCGFLPAVAVAAAISCYLAWCAHAHQRFALSNKSGVSALLAGIALVDLIPLSGLAAAGNVPLPFLAFPVLTFLLALILQRLASAT